MIFLNEEESSQIPNTILEKIKSFCSSKEEECTNLSSNLEKSKAESGK